jgi:hypothetical protein
MSILKSFDLNSTTLGKIENLKIVLYGFFYICVKFHGNFIIKGSTS